MTREFFLKESMIMLSVVIPTFNESKNIRNLVAQIDVALKGIDYEIVFVDDSKDNTPDVIMEVAKEYPQVRMEHRKNGTGSVSYTHLTLPTKRIFEISMDDESLKKKMKQYYVE